MYVFLNGADFHGNKLAPQCMTRLDKNFRSANCGDHFFVVHVCARSMVQEINAYTFTYTTTDVWYWRKSDSSLNLVL